VKIDVPIEWDDRVQRRSSEERYEVPAYGKQDEDNVDCLVNVICTWTYYVALGLRLLRSLHISLCYTKVVITYRMTSQTFPLRY
jgi:hypothetical protein